MDDEGETVILKNSPLYSYIASSGDDDTAVKEEKNVLLQQLRESGYSDAKSSASSRSSLFRKFYSSSPVCWLFSPFSALSNVNFVDLPRRLFFPQSEDFRTRFLRLFLTSRLLDDDDAAVLRAEYEARIEKRNDPENQIPSYLKWISLIFGGALTVVYIWCRRVLRDNYNGTATAAIFHVVDNVRNVALIAFGARLLYEWRSNRTLMNSAGDIVRRSREMDDLVRKSLRVIREYEVLARGYTVVTKYTVVTNKNDKSVSDDDNKNSKFALPCLELRKCVFLAAEDLFALFRRWTLEISEKNTESARNEKDNHPFLLANVDDLRSMFGDYSLRKDWEISLNVLHACAYCVCLQRSEFFRVYASSRISSRQKFLESLASTISAWMRRINGVLTNYEYHPSRYYPNNNRSDLVSENNYVVVDPRYDYVRSLSLHLRLALEKSSECEKQLIGSDSDRSAESLFDADDYIENMRSTLQKCQTCLEELEQLVAANSSSPKRPDGLATSTSGQNRGDGAPHLIYDYSEGERPIVDQVFEDYARPEAAYYRKDAEECNDDGSYNNEQNAQLFRSGRRHVLDELKNVLIVRSSIMRERELKALASARGVSVQELLEEEEAEKAGKSEEKDRRDEEAEIERREMMLDAIRGANNFQSELTRALRHRSEVKREIILGDDSSSDGGADDEDEKEKNKR